MKPGLDLDSSDKLGLYQSNDLIKIVIWQREIWKYDTLAV